MYIYCLKTNAIFLISFFIFLLGLSGDQRGEKGKLKELLEKYKIQIKILHLIAICILCHGHDTKGGKSSGGSSRTNSLHPKKLGLGVGPQPSPIGPILQDPGPSSFTALLKTNVENVGCLSGVGEMQMGAKCQQKKYPKFLPKIEEISTIFKKKSPPIEKN